MFSPGANTNRLVGIAKLAASGEELASKQRVTYRELPTRRFITKCESDRVPFEWTINPYRGCEFGCRYCYARYTHEFMELRDPYEFETKIFAKQWRAEAFREELRRIPRGDWVAIGTATDPYQPAERQFGVTRRILAEVARMHGLRISVTTKSDLAPRDIDLFQAIARGNILHIALSITTPDDSLARLMEPYAPRPQLRLEAVRKLSAAGLQTGVLACPLLPLINDGEAMLDRLAQLVKEAGAVSFSGGLVFLRPCSREVFFAFLDQHFPRLAGRYRQRFRDRAFLDGAYAGKIADRIRRLRERYGLAGRFPDYRPAEWLAGSQIELPFAEGGRSNHFLKKSTCHKYAASL